MARKSEEAESLHHPSDNSKQVASPEERKERASPLKQGLQKKKLSGGLDPSKEF